MAKQRKSKYASEIERELRRIRAQIRYYTKKGYTVKPINISLSMKDNKTKRDLTRLKKFNPKKYLQFRYYNPKTGKIKTETAMKAPHKKYQPVNEGIKGKGYGARGAVLMTEWEAAIDQLRGYLGELPYQFALQPIYAFLSMIEVKKELSNNYKRVIFENMGALQKWIDKLRGESDPRAYYPVEEEMINFINYCLSPRDFNNTDTMKAYAQSNTDVPVTYDEELNAIAFLDEDIESAYRDMIRESHKQRNLNLIKKKASRVKQTADTASRSNNMESRWRDMARKNTPKHRKKK